MTVPNLRVVEPAAEAPIDITAQLRKDIAKRDWAKCHIEGDRRAAIRLGDAGKWRWR